MLCIAQNCCLNSCLPEIMKSLLVSRYIYILFLFNARRKCLFALRLLIEWKVVKNEKKLYDPFPLKAICWKDNETITYSNNSTVAKMLSLVWKKNTRLTSLDKSSMVGNFLLLQQYFYKFQIIWKDLVKWKYLIFSQ